MPRAHAVNPLLTQASLQSHAQKLRHAALLIRPGRPRP
jgi:hypothetical protein